MNGPIRVGFLGYGYWGKNVLRTLLQEPRVLVDWACDLSPERVAQIRADCPGLRTTTNYRAIMDDPKVHAVVIVTPAETHVPLATEALQSGKHVFVEKPMATNLRDAEELAAMVRRTGLLLQVGHIFEYAPAVRVLKRWIESGRLGNISYITANRSSLGPRLRTDVNIVWDYAIHDLYLLMHLLGTPPDRVAARGMCRFYSGIEDTVFIDLYFPGGTWAVVHSSWIAPTKRRDVILVGNQSMAVYDETRKDKLVLHKRGFERRSGYDNWGNLDWHLFDEGEEVPILEAEQPLATELSSFCDCLENGRQPLSDIEDGLRTIRVLEAISRSLNNNGREVPISEESNAL